MRLLLKRQDLFAACNNEIFSDSQLCFNPQARIEALGSVGPQVPFKAIKIGNRVWEKQLGSGELKRRRQNRQGWVGRVFGK